MQRSIVMKSLVVIFPVAARFRNLCSGFAKQHNFGAPVQARKPFNGRFFQPY